MSADIDLIVLTQDEEKNLPYCVASVEGLVRNIFLVDSGSTDATLSIAEKHGARIFEHPFETQAQQLTWALDNLPFESDWILRLDGDEYLTDELRGELNEVLETLPPEVAGLYMKRRLIFMGKWIRHGTYYPTWIMRLWRRGHARSEEIEFNEHMVLTEGRSAKLKHDFVDHDRYGLREWIHKHEGYAERHIRFLQTIKASKSSSLRPSLAGSQAQRRRWTEVNLYARAPLFLRAVIYFLYRYFIRLGFLDGTRGLVFHFLHAFWYRFYIDARIFEQKRSSRPGSAQDG